MGTLINGNSGLWGHISWDKSSCMLISSDKRDSTSDKGDIFIFNIYFLDCFQQSKANFIAVKVRDHNLQKVIPVLFLTPAVLCPV